MIERLTYRPVAGGTKDGARPFRYDYWRTGYGSSLSQGFDFFLSQAGEYHCKAGYVSGEYEFTPRYQFFYHIDGQALFECRGVLVELTEGDLLMIPPSTVYNYTSRHGVKYHWFALEGECPKALCPDDWRLLHLGYDAVLESILVAMRENLILCKPGYALRALAHFFEAMARIEELSGSFDQPESAYPEAVRNALVYLREHYDMPFDAEKTAAAVGISKSHLRALFNKWVGESPQHYHTRCRIDHAKRLLREQGLLVFEVAYHVGYNDARYFARVFKKFTGQTPSEYANA
ncbi:MAG: AraC family transcriptional regulator [Chloroflexi bacterium]|nr:AraC family transcriptional regulator [Chloroflexota bacterium]